MEIFILYNFYIFFIFKSYLKKNICAPKPELQNTPAREPPTARTFTSSTDSISAGAHSTQERKKTQFQDTGRPEAIIQFPQQYM